MRYRLRTLLILLAILPPIVAVSWWQYSAWKAEWEVRAAIEELERELERQAESDQLIFHITEAPSAAVAAAAGRRGAV